MGFWEWGKREVTLRPESTVFFLISGKHIRILASQILPIFLPSIRHSVERLCRNEKNPIAVMLSAAKHLAFQSLRKMRSFGYRLIYESFVKWVIHSLIFVKCFSTHFHWSSVILTRCYRTHLFAVLCGREIFHNAVAIRMRVSVDP